LTKGASLNWRQEPSWFKLLFSSLAPNFRRVVFPLLLLVLRLDCFRSLLFPPFLRSSPDRTFCHRIVSISWKPFSALPVGSPLTAARNRPQSLLVVFPFPVSEASSFVPFCSASAKAPPKPRSCFSFLPDVFLDSLSFVLRDTPPPAPRHTTPPNSRSRP